MPNLASDYEVTYSGDGTGDQESNRNAPCVRLTENDYDVDGNVAFNFGNIDAPALTIGIRFRAKNGNPAGDFLWNPNPVTQVIVTPDPQIWIEYEVSYNASTDSLDVDWRLHAQGNGAPLTVNVNHSDVTTGAPTDYPWGLEANRILLEAPYSYSRSAIGGRASLVFTVKPGVDYVVPNTATRPASVTIDVASYMPPKETDTGGGGARPIPATADVEYNDSVMNLTDTDIDTATGRILITGKRIRSLNPSVFPINFDGVNGAYTLAMYDNIIEAAGAHVSGGYKRPSIEAKNNIHFGRPDIADTPIGSNAYHLFATPSAVIENNYVERCGLVKVEYDGFNAGTYKKMHVRYNKAKNLNKYDGHANFIGLRGSGQYVDDVHIAYNQSFMQEGLGRSEDQITIYHLKARVGKGIIENNFLDGNWRDIPIVNHTGLGIIIDGTANDLATACENWIIRYNHAVRQAHGCYGIAQGINCQAYGNRGITAAKFADGTAYGNHTFGMYSTDYGSSMTVSRGNKVFDNFMGVVTVGGSNGAYNYEFFNTGPDFYQNNNQSMQTFPTRADEDYEYTVFGRKLTGIVIGPIGAPTIKVAGVDDGTDDITIQIV